MTERTKIRLAIAALLGCLFVTALLDDPAMYEPEPGPNAPMFFDHRNGEWVQP